MSIGCPRPLNEDARLEALEALDIFDTDPEARFDRIVRLASDMLDIPVALMPLVGSEELRFKAAHGLQIERNGRDQAFCAYTIMDDGVFIVPDALEDPRFQDNPAVVSGPKLRFYAGAPLSMGEGLNIGALCVMDSAPRTDFDEKKQRILADLAAIASDEIRMRAALSERARDAADRIDSADVLARGARRAKERFLALMGHELHTPLNGAMGFSQALQAEPFGPLGAEEYRNFAAQITQSCKRLERTIEQLISFADLENGQVQMFEEAIDLEAEIAQCCASYAPDAAIAGVRLTHQRKSAPAEPFYGDRGMITQMLGQIIGNALKFSPSGGQVRIWLDDDKARGARIIIEDDGEGVAPDIMPRLMRAFEKLDPDMDHPMGGVGLGLPLTKMLVERHGGGLTIAPRAEGGSRAMLIFPPWRNAPRREAAA